MPVLFRVIGNRGTDGCADPSVIMGTVQPPIGLHGLGDQGLHFDRFGHVGSDEDSFSALFCDHMDGLLSTVYVHISDDELGSLPSKGQGSGSPNPGSTSCD